MPTFVWSNHFAGVIFASVTFAGVITGLKAAATIITKRNTSQRIVLSLVSVLDLIRKSFGIIAKAE